MPVNYSGVAKRVGIVLALALSSVLNIAPAFAANWSNSDLFNLVCKR